MDGQDSSDGGQPTGGGRAGWYSHTPSWAVTRGHGTEPEEPPVRWVDLRSNEIAGPFWEEEGALGDEYDDLQRMLGISRELIDDAFAWNERACARPCDATPGHDRDLWHQQQALLRRLDLEVRPGIVVRAARSEPPTQVQLSRLNTDAAGSGLVLWDAAAVETGRPTPLPAVPEALARRIVAWVAEGWKFDHTTPQSNEAALAWQHVGSSLARDLRPVLGDDYEVVSR